MELRGFVAGMTAAVLIMLGLVAVAPAIADTESCGAVIGMSVVRNTYLGSSLDESREAELIWHPGSVLGDWANPDSPIWGNLRTENDCGEPLWASFGFDPTPVRRVNGYSGSNQAQLDALLDAAVQNIRARWPSIQRLDLWIIVGGYDNSTCPAGSRTVRATEFHRDVQAGLEDYLARRPDVGAGPDIEIDCSGFSDWIGHLSEAGQTEAGAFLDAWYLSKPEPDTTTTVEAATTTVEEITTTSEETTTSVDDDSSTTLESDPTTTIIEETTTTVENESTTTVDDTTTTTLIDPTTTLPACDPEP